MAHQTPPVKIDLEDAFHFTVRYVREGMKTGYSDYGYELYLPNVMREYLRLTSSVDHDDAQSYMPQISPAFYAAAWEMCRRGILRPGIKRYGEQATEDGASGNGYSLTPAGREWFARAGQYEYVPIEPGRFARMLDVHTERFGRGFQERSQEAIRCYDATAYLACCAMCGAAAESIVLALAAAKTGDADQVLRVYQGAGGRTKIENVILSQKPAGVQNEFRGYSSLLKYWRDVAAHGSTSGITDNEAYTALALLLRFAQFVSNKWDELTGNP